MAQLLQRFFFISQVFLQLDERSAVGGAAPVNNNEKVTPLIPVTFLQPRKAPESVDADRRHSTGNTRYVDRHVRCAFAQSYATRRDRSQPIGAYDLLQLIVQTGVHAPSFS